MSYYIFIGKTVQHYDLVLQFSVRVLFFAGALGTFAGKMYFCELPLAPSIPSVFVSASKIVAGVLLFQNNPLTASEEEEQVWCPCA